MLTDKTNNNNPVSLNRLASHIDDVRQQVVEKTLIVLKSNPQLRADIEKAVKSVGKANGDQAVDFKKIKEIIEKMKKVAEQLGLRYELATTELGGAQIKIYNEITNKQVGTIPFNVILTQINQGLGIQKKPSAVAGSDGILV